MKSDPARQPREFHCTLRREVRVAYLLFLPKDYQAQPARRWPLILFLHGAGERGSDLRRVAKHGPPKYVRSHPDFPFLVASPQCPGGRTWSSDVLLALLDHLEQRYRIDRSRVYLTGLSMGGYGAWSLGLRHPARFAAVAPICGGGDILRTLLPAPGQTAALRALPIWAFHGAQDDVVPVSESERMVRTLRSIGCRDITLTVHAGAGHDAWTQTYDQPALYRWFLEHRRPRRLAASSCSAR